MMVSAIKQLCRARKYFNKMKTKNQLLSLHQREFDVFPVQTCFNISRNFEWLINGKQNTSVIREFSSDYRRYNSQLNKIPWWLRG